MQRSAENRRCKSFRVTSPLWRSSNGRIFLYLFEPGLSHLKEFNSRKNYLHRQIEWVQKDVIKFERTQIQILAKFSLPSSSSFLKLPNIADVSVLVAIMTEIVIGE